jgi:predicted transcriptional regulator|tara:strand:+ start:1381 stop:2034 length:654 start_codon:yes stop_codon:yes gene_type:complete
MALVDQWRFSRPWYLDSIGAIAGAALGIGGSVQLLFPAAQGTMIAHRETGWEHPLRLRIVDTLEKSPGIHFRELQRRLDAANGTLRHHLDILTKEGVVTIVPVNGRTCYYFGAPAQVEILEGTGVTDDVRAASMMPVGLSEVQKVVVARLTEQDSPESQAQLARDLGRSRASVHSAISVLRERGILNQSGLELAPHLNGLKRSSVDYPWLDIRVDCS